MQITEITNTNYVGNPGFEADLQGWSVAGGNMQRVITDSYDGTACAQLVPNSNFSLIEYPMSAMSTGLSYIGQARVKGGAGQELFVRFDDGTGYQSFIASGNWDLLTTLPVVKNTANFSVQVGIGSQFNISVQDNVTTSENYSINAHGYSTSVSDSIKTNETYKITFSGHTFISTLNIAVSDTTTTSENYALKRASDAVWDSRFNYAIITSDSATTSDLVRIQPDTTVDRTIYIDDVMVEVGITPSNYFDGDSGQGYHWYGVEYDSESYYRQFEVEQASLDVDPQWGVLISWTKQLNSVYAFFTIGTSTIGGPDFIGGSSLMAPSYFNQYQYQAYSDYLLSASVTQNIGQYPYGAFGAQLSMVLDNTDFLFLPGFDPTIGSFITAQRPIQFQVGFNGESINLFAGNTTKPANDSQNRTLTITAFDGMDFLNSFISTGAGPIALANNGTYVNLPAQTIISDLLQEAGFNINQFVLEQSLQQNIGYLVPANYSSNDSSGAEGSIGSIISDLCEAEQGIFFFDGQGIAHFWNRQHIPTNTDISWRFDYSDIVNFETEDTPIINDVTIQAMPREVQANQNIWQLTSAVLVPPATSTLIVTNMSINPNFVSTTGSYFNSPLTVSTQDTVNSSERIFESNVTHLTINVNDATQTSENLGFQSSRPIVSDSIVTGESYSIKVGTNTPFVSALKISVIDSTTTGENMFIKGREQSQKELILEFINTSEAVHVVIAGTAGKIPYITDSASTYETYNLSTVTVTGWGVINATLYQNSFGPIVPNSGSVTVQGGTNSYLVQQYNCLPLTQYVSQCEVLGIPSTTVTMVAVQGTRILASTSVTLDGEWDTIALQPFDTDASSSTFQIRVYANGPTTFNIGAVMTQLGVGATSTYFDGDTLVTSNYLFAWTGSPYVSTSTATPVGSVVIEAQFEDDNGSLPATTVDTPVYNNPNLDSTYLTNLNEDSSGIPGNQYIQLATINLNGATYTMTFINTYTQPVYVTQCSLFGTPAKVTYAINVEYKDPTSIALYGTNPTNNGQTLIIQNDLIQDPSTAQSNAYQMVTDYANPYQRMTADVFPAYMLQIGDNVMFTINDTGQTQAYKIVGTTNGVGTDGEPQQNLEVEVKQQVHYFTINQSIIGGTDSIAP